MKHRQTNGFINFAQRVTTPEIGRNTRLLPRDLFDGHPEILDLYDRLTALRDAEAEHSRTANLERDAAARATEKYKAEVREALATGKDASKIRNDTDRHTAQAEAHAQFARDAAVEAARVSHRLAPLIAAAASSLTNPSELVMEQAAKRVNGAIENLRKEWAAWSDAWKVRTILSQADLFGGQLVNYQPTGKLPADVATALDTLADKLHDLERLKEDEQKYRAWRAEEERAQAANARALR
ncbi:hypothetical protein [Microbacterium timonense]|uniref:hypothetical protein n=1 Tax=Microbacterium timonense TaxID=2086576 RepID=UPI000D0EFAD9|nr:hypothetical protein [Microbacterium timonense]